MRKDILIAGVGGQGILSLAFVLDHAAMEAGFYFKQTEVHGMAQRGGAVVSQVRISDQPVYSDMIPIGGADIILGIEPLESLRYIEYLKPGGLLLVNSEPYINIPDYPDLKKIMEAIASYKHIVICASELAKKAGSSHAQNIVLLGALSSFLPIAAEIMVKWVRTFFQSKGEKIAEMNATAFQMGREAIEKD